MDKQPLGWNSLSQIPVFFLCRRGRPHFDSGLINSAVFQEKRIKSPIVKFVQLYIQMQIYGARNGHFPFIADYAYFCSLLRISSAFFSFQLQRYGGNKTISKNKCSLFVRFSALFISHCKDTTSAISASGYGGLRPVSQGQMRINPLLYPISTPIGR